MSGLAAMVSWLALAFVGLVRLVGGNIPRLAKLPCALIAAPIALAAAVQVVSQIWRGPTIVPFARSEAVPCTAGEAAFIRASAQLRGTMGGAGHLYPRRLLLPAAAWLGVAGVGVSMLFEPLDAVICPWTLAVGVVAAVAAFVFPARSYFYRETTGGGALLCPPSAAYRLKRRSELAAALARGERVEAVTPAPTPSPPAMIPVSGAGPNDPPA